jgi:hypothetical protein
MRLHNQGNTLLHFGPGFAGLGKWSLVLATGKSTRGNGLLDFVYASVDFVTAYVDMRNAFADFESRQIETQIASG